MAEPNVVESYLHMLAAVVEDVAGAVRRVERGDPFNRRDPRYIDRTLVALRATPAGWRARCRSARRARGCPAS